MDFALSEDEKLILQTARELSRAEFLPKAEEIDETSKFPHENVAKLSELGFMGMMVDEKWGGAGLSSLAYAIAIEEVSYACASTGVIMSVNNSLVCDPIERYGTDQQKEKWLKPLASGELLGAYCLTEPNAGSDASQQKTIAVPDGNEIVLNGSKNFITNGQVADVLVVYCMTDPSAGNRGISCFIVDAKEKGVELGKKENTMGIRGSSTCTIAFNDVRVPKENQLGPTGKGFNVALSTLDGGRIGIAAQALGIAAHALDQATKYSQERIAFGKPIAELQAIQWMIADSVTELEAARLLVHQAAVKKDSGERYSPEAAMAKLAASRAAVTVSDRAVQIHGGYGYIKEYSVERCYRDAKITEIYEGTSEIQRLVIARNLLK
ncbi:MAG: acyl-CoA dehydrogenase [Candidatus Eisenbacteria bacterium]|uniref:Acyl-CoA dehydrogenase n=1 Tax=Eiseniibacteriota bacterium TaxID=2212470 RepID=A0A7Y2H199_UNCEI|nr:acyl-CoA dehydrogenase [Candidatus Eisenbacteria bacterium]